jgi:hypothetical protein
MTIRIHAYTGMSRATWKPSQAWAHDAGTRLGARTQARLALEVVVPRRTRRPGGSARTCPLRRFDFRQGGSNGISARSVRALCITIRLGSLAPCAPMHRDPATRASGQRPAAAVVNR